MVLARRPSRKTATGAAVWVIADQASQSVLTMAFTILAARSLSAQAFGWVATAQVLHTLLLGMTRAWAHELLLVFGTTSSELRIRSKRSARVAAAIEIVSVLALTLLSGQWIATAILPLGLAQLTADPIRYSLLANNEVEELARAGGLGAIAALVLAASCAAAGLSVNVQLAALLAGPAAYVFRRGPIQEGAGSSNLDSAETRRAARSFLSDFVAQVGIVAGVFLVAGAFGTAADVGGLRGLQTLFGPLTLSLYAVQNHSTVLIARAQSARAVQNLILSSTVLSLCLAVLYPLPLIVIRPLGEALLGEAWGRASDVLVPFLLLRVAQTPSFPATAFLRATGRGGWGAWLRWGVGGLAATIAIGWGAIGGGPRGLVWGLFLGHALGIVPWMIAVRSAWASTATVAVAD